MPIRSLPLPPLRSLPQVPPPLQSIDLLPLGVPADGGGDLGEEPKAGIELRRFLELAQECADRACQGGCKHLLLDINVVLPTPTGISNAGKLFFHATCFARRSKPLAW